MHVVNSHWLVPVQSNGQEPFCSAVKQSNSKSDGQNFLNLVLAVTTARMGVTTPPSTLGPTILHPKDVAWIKSVFLNTWYTYLLSLADKAEPTSANMQVKNCYRRIGLQSASKSTLVERGVVTQVIVSLTTSDNARATNTLYSSLTSVLTDFLPTYFSI